MGILAATVLTNGLALSFVIVTLILAIGSFIGQYFTVRYYQTHNYKDTLWFFIKRHFFLICGCMFAVAFVGALISYLRLFS